MTRKIISLERAVQVSLFLIIVSILGYLFWKKSESFSFLTDEVKNDERFVFLNKKQACEIFKTDPDAYFERLNELDRHAMKLPTTEVAIQHMCKNSRSFTPEEQAKIIRCCIQADQFFRNVNIPYFDGNKAAEMNWNFVITIGTSNEEGMPHTKGDIIYISDIVISYPDTELTATLIHEKIHVYERKYPDLMEKWMKWAGYKRYRYQSQIETARSNPDVDGWTYIDPMGKETVVHYNVHLAEGFSHLKGIEKYSKLPTSIYDSIYPHNDSADSEHPYEMLAYRIDNMYTQMVKNKPN
jgi:hypothetical protein